VHAAAGAGFRSIGAKYLGVRFRHLDLPAGSSPSEAASAILAALHTGDESELALRNGVLYAKRIVEGDACLADSEPADPQHVLIVGGTGNLGLEFCDHFARRGARRITLVSRSGETPGVADRLQRIRSASSTQIRVAQCDVSDEAAVSLLAQQHPDTPADLIIHAAVHYSGSELENITIEMVDQDLRPKVVGIWRVLATFPRTDNCHVVLCSSISATVGGRGMILYAAANRMLDAMAHRLRTEEVDCASVQWGHWNVHPDVDGYSLSKLGSTGVIAMRPADALAVGMTTPFRSNAIVASFDVDRARSVLETCGRASLLSQLSVPNVKTPAPVTETDLSQRLMKVLAQAIGVDRAETIDREVPMVAIGLDSLQALEVRRRVKIEFNHDLEVADLLGGASIADVLAQLGG
jgi:mycobactin polyketide synthetase MbtD